jgi:hypothetical protein
MPGMAQHQDRRPVTLLQDAYLHSRQMRAHPGQDNLRRYGLDNVIDAASLKAGGLVRDVAVTCDKDHLYVVRRVERPDLPAQLVAINVWQTDVQQHQ